MARKTQAKWGRDGLHKLLCLLAALILLCGCDSSTPSPIPAPSITPGLTATPTPVMTAAPTLPNPPPEEYESTPPPIHPDIEPLVVYDWPPDDTDDVRRFGVYDPAPRFELPVTKSDEPFFCADDLICGDLRPGMTQDEVLDILDRPMKAYVYQDDMFCIWHLVLFYENSDYVELWDEFHAPSFKLNAVYIFSDLPGPRGLAVGDR